MRLRAVLPDLHHSPHTTSMARSTPPFPTSLLGCTASWACGILLAGVLLTAAACEKETLPSGPTEADIARCAHVEDPFLNMICLDNPWPTELPPATQEGLSTFGCWINDTLAFVAGDPREPARKEAYANRYIRSAVGLHLIGYRRTWGEIDSRSLFFLIRINEATTAIDTTSMLRIRGIPGLNGTYGIINNNSTVSFTRNDAQVVSGIFNLVLVSTSTTDTLRLTDGRFDVRVATF